MPGTKLMLLKILLLFIKSFFNAKHCHSGTHSPAGKTDLVRDAGKGSAEEVAMGLRSQQSEEHNQRRWRGESGPRKHSQSY